MKKEGSIGAAAFLAIAAVVGVTLQFGSKQSTVGQAERAPTLRRPSESEKKPSSPELEHGCQLIEQHLRDFLNIREPIAPKECYEQDRALWKEIPREIGNRNSNLKFVIATLPDPLHTHQAVLFDQFAAAIQEAAQDERYDFDSSWLPWEDGSESYALLADQEKAESQRELREQQPGILLFRSSGGLSDNDAGLIVFVVAEDATHGIHKDQFRSALAWVDALVPEKIGRRIGILGPTFSGSLSSLTQLLSEEDLPSSSNLIDVYSGSVSSNGAATSFRKINLSKVAFHSFVQNDDLIIDRFCDYMKWKQFDAERFAILSEDETAYGHSGVSDKLKGKSATTEKGSEGDKGKSGVPMCTDSALWLYYPKDISALRGAYQTKSIFDLGSGASPPDSQGRSLPSDLADPAGKVHDSIRSYGSNQTPLMQEAFLLEIVAALRDFHARYILLRGSNNLDQLFLANFLRRMYPDGRLVILSSDLLFIRERGATGLNGTMTLTNYPLFPLARDWTEAPNNPAADRVFSSDTSEGTYIASRVLLNSKSLNERHEIDANRCHVTDDVSGPIFVPTVACGKEPSPDYSPVPDYSPPYWVAPVHCDETEACNYAGPATWLTVIGVNRFWPIASLTASTSELDRGKAASDTNLNEQVKASRESQIPSDVDASNELGRKLEMPPGMKVFFAVLIAFAVFHAWCCWRGSYTAKPNFLAHFATVGDWRHTVLVFSGSSLLAFIAIVGAWGCGAFSLPAYSFAHPEFALGCVLIVCVIAWTSIIGRIATVWRLSVSRQRKFDVDAQKAERVSLPRDESQFKLFHLRKSSEILRASLIFLAVLAFLGLQILIAEHLLDKYDRALTYWRAMNMSSGVSPVVPLIALLVGFYLWFWFTLHGLALFGSDRPRLPLLRDLKIRIKTGQQAEDGYDFLRIFGGKNSKQEEKYYDFLRMFSQQGAVKKIEKAGIPLARKTIGITAALFVLLLLATWIFADGVFLRGLGPRSNAAILMFWLFACISLQLVEAWWLCILWQELRSLLTFLDRLPLRRTLATMRGISWSNVWRMGGNVLEVRYKVISRQLESMNHSISSLEKVKKDSKDSNERQAADDCLTDLKAMRAAGTRFAGWYQHAYTDPSAGDLTSFRTFQWSVAKATGTLLSRLLIPTWRKESRSLIVASTAEKEPAAQSAAPEASEEYVRNAEEFVSLTYLGFIQNILGRVRTLAMTIMVLFFATTIALSTYPFDPRRVISAILIALFIFLGTAVFKVYVEMHRDPTLSNITNTRPGALDPEFWVKVLAFGFAPLVGLLTRIFPGIGDFIFTWIQPGISSLR